MCYRQQCHIEPWHAIQIKLRKVVSTKQRLTCEAFAVGPNSTFLRLHAYRGVIQQPPSLEHGGPPNQRDARDINSIETMGENLEKSLMAAILSLSYPETEKPQDAYALQGSRITCFPFLVKLAYTRHPQQFQAQAPASTSR